MPFEPVPVTSDDLVTFLSERHGEEVQTPALREAAAHYNCSYATVKKRLQKYNVGKGKWNLTVAEALERNYQQPAVAPAVEIKNLVPDVDTNYVPFGNFSDLKKIIKSKVFYPVFITGLSGNGKTFGVEQACASLKRELIRVNITVETDEDDLIGGFRLQMEAQYGIMVLLLRHLSEELCYY